MSEPVPARFQPVEILRALTSREVRFVLIGAFAATLHGSAVRTGDADITPASDRDNLDRLAAALRDLTDGYDDLAAKAVTYEGEGVRVRVASLLDVIRPKEAAGRPKDHAMLPTLRKLFDRITREL